MKKSLLSSGWQVRTKATTFAQGITPPDSYRDITLPHDPVITSHRSPENPPAAGYFPSRTFEYRRTVRRDSSRPITFLEFEGVYRNARVYLDGALVGENASGYTGFLVDIGRFMADDNDHELIVEARCGDDSRWYSGGGLYRPVHLLTSGEVYLTPGRTRVTTLELDSEFAHIEVALEVTNASLAIRTVEARVEVRNSEGAIVGGGSTPVTVLPGEPAVSRHHLLISNPAAWTAETPSLYSVDVKLCELDGADNTKGALDTDQSTFGIRTISVDPARGFRVNGTRVILRGACIHHDNGLLGAAAFGAAEERRVRRLKEAGFNAIRSTHNPMSVALLKACDKWGMYVLDESFDMWTTTKTIEDYSNHFLEWWERDIESMVTKDFNHPSVVMYSIGNEIPETGSTWGGILSRRLAEKVRSLDTTRPITNAINGMLAVMDEVRAMAEGMGGGMNDGADINTMMSMLPDLMHSIGASDMVTNRTAESFGALDIAGMNYLESRYETDLEIFPNRVTLGTENFPREIATNWKYLTTLPQVIGDFTWTGWDYLGEVGIGRVQTLHPGEIVATEGQYPWVAAWCGDIDIIGDRRPMSYYREIVFGLRHTPYVTVRPPLAEDETEFPSPWSFPDGLAGWTWPGHEGKEMRIEVYSDADQVELLLNGERVAVLDTGADHSFTASTTLSYQPGELTARGIRNGVAAESIELSTGSGITLATEVEQVFSEHDNHELAFVTISLTDVNGVPLFHEQRDITVQVTGAELLAVGCANPVPDVFLNGNTGTTFRGRAMAIVNLNGETTAEVRISVDGVEDHTLTLERSGRVFTA